MRAPFLPGPALLLVVTVLIGCDGSASEDDFGAIRDTLPNGAERVRYGGLPSEPFQVLTPELTIGMLEGDPNYIFGDVRGIEVGDDGSIYVLDFQAAELRAFEPDGSFRASVARGGQGPGEITQANGLVRAPDGSLWVQDHAHWQILRLSPEGGEIERIPMLVRQYGYLWDGSVDDHGRIWTASSRSPMSENPVQPEPGVREGRVERSMVVYDPISGAGDSVLVGSFETRSYVVALEGGWSFRGIPFQPSLVTAVDPAGGVWRAMTDVYRIDRIDVHGDTTLVIEVDVPAPRVTAEDHQAFIDSARERGPDEERFAREIVRVMAERKPVLSQLVTDDEGRLWVRRFQEADETSQFDVFDRSGAFLGSVQLDFRTPGYFPPRIREGRLHTLAIDALDVPSVVRTEVDLASASR